MLILGQMFGIVLDGVGSIVGKGSSFFFSCDVFESLLLQVPNYANDLTHSHTMTPFDTPGKQAF